MNLESSFLFLAIFCPIQTCLNLLFNKISFTKNLFRCLFTLYKRGCHYTGMVSHLSNESTEIGRYPITKTLQPACIDYLILPFKHCIKRL